MSNSAIPPDGWALRGSGFRLLCSVDEREPYPRDRFVWLSGVGGGAAFRQEGPRGLASVFMKPKPTNQQTAGLWCQPWSWW